jgi:hypothetical protein
MLSLCAKTYELPSRVKFEHDLPKLSPGKQLDLGLLFFLDLLPGPKPFGHAYFES